jgi:hypothetical protein
MTGLTISTFRGTSRPSQPITLGVSPSASYPLEVWDPIRAWRGDGPVTTGTSTTSTLTIPPLPGGWKLGVYIPTLPGEDVSSVATIIDKTDTRFPNPPLNNFPYSGAYALWGVVDPRTRGMMSPGTYRLTVEKVTDPGVDDPPWSVDLKTGGVTGLLDIVTELQTWWAAHADSVHPRHLLAAFATPHWAADSLPVKRTGSVVGRFYARNAADGAHVFVTVAAGTTSGAKVTVDRDGASVAVYDNLADGPAIETALAANAHVMYLPHDQNQQLPDLPVARTAIGDVCFTNVGSVVAALYDAGVTRFEGPSNEPQDLPPGWVAQEFKHMKAAGKAARSGALFGGLCPVGLNYVITGRPGQGPGWLEKALAYLGPGVLEFWTDHIYNSGEVLDLIVLEHLLDRRDTQLAAAGYAGIEKWMTEQPATSWWYGLARFRSSVVSYLMQELACEQRGGAPERSHRWHDADIFWRGSLVSEDRTLHPLMSASRQLTAARWDRGTRATLDFGQNGRRRWIGSRWTVPDGSGALGILDVAGGSALGVRLTVSGSGTATIEQDDVVHSATITAGAGQLLVADYAGHIKRITVTAGATVVVPRPMAYVEKPAGVTINVVPVDLGTDHLTGKAVTSPSGSAAVSVPPSRMTEGLAAVKAPILVAQEWDGVVAFASGVYNPWKSGSNVFPQTVAEIDMGATVLGLTVAEVEGAVLWQAGNTSLLGFAVELSTNGTTWTRVAEVDEDPTDWYVLRELTGSKHAKGVTGQPWERTRALVWHPDTSHWLLPLQAPTDARYARLIVTRSSAHGALDETLRGLSAAAGNVGLPNDRRPTVRGFRVYSGDPSAIALASEETTPGVFGSGRYVVKAGTLTP